MSDTIYARSPDVVWRLGPDRVLVRRVAVPDGHAQDLQGAAALVWVTLDEPGTASDVADRIIAAGFEAEADVTTEAIHLLVDEQLVVVQPTDH